VEELKVWLHARCTTPSTTYTPTLPTTPLKLSEWSRLLSMAVTQGHITQHKTDKLLRQLHEGFRLGVNDNIPPPETVRSSPNLQSARPELPSHDPVVSLKILQSLHTEILAGRTAGPFLSPPFTNLQISPIGAVPKAHSSKLRLIHHLSWPRASATDLSTNDRLNEAKCEYLKFSEFIKKVGELGPTYLMSKFDIKDAFRLLRVIPSEHYLLGIHYAGFYFYEQCIPFGVHSGPSLFEEFAIAVEAIMHSQAVENVFHYADDFPHIAHPDHAEREYNLILQVFATLGIPLSIEKLSPPSTSIEFLGTVIDCARQIMYIPEDKLERYRTSIALAAASPLISITSLQSLLGVLRYSARCVQHGTLFLHHLQNSLTNALSSQRDRHLKSFKLSHAALEELKWWERFITEWNGRNIIPPSLSSFPITSRRSLFTDACRTGMGAWLRQPHELARTYSKPQYLLHAWTTTELGRAQRSTTLSMPYLELLALVLAVYAWRKELAGSAIDLQSDCMPVVNALTRGYSRTTQIHQLLLSLFHISNNANIFISCSHIAGVKNIEADVLSRIANSNTNLQSASLSSDFFTLPSVSLFYSTGRIIQKEMEPLPSAIYAHERSN